MQYYKNETGFTLVEILVVMAILAVLAIAIFAYLNPVARFQDSRNSTRQADVDSILKAAQLYAADNNGKYPTGLITLDTGDFTTVGGQTVPNCKPFNSSSTVTCTTWSSTSGTPGALLLQSASGKSYLQNIPTDPSGGSNFFYGGVTNDGQHVVVSTDSMEPGINGIGPVFYMSN